MSRVIRLVACLAVCLIAGSSQATIVHNWYVDDSNFTGLGAPPAGFRAFNLRVNSTTDWTNARLDINLTGGSMYHILGIDGFPPGLQPLPGPQGLGDTSVFSPNNPSESRVAGIYTETATQWGVSWFNQTTTNIGNGQLIARLVLSNDAIGTLTGAVIAGADVDDFGFVLQSATRYRISGGTIQTLSTFPITDPFVPEPASIVLAGVGGLLLAAVARRRRPTCVTLRTA